MACEAPMMFTHVSNCISYDCLYQTYGTISLSLNKPGVFLSLSHLHSPPYRELCVDRGICYPVEHSRVQVFAEWVGPVWWGEALRCHPDFHQASTPCQDGETQRQRCPAIPVAALQGGSEGEDDYIVKHSGAGVDLVEGEEGVPPGRRPQGAGNKGSRLA